MNETITRLEGQIQRLKAEQARRSSAIVRKMFSGRPSSLPKRIRHQTAAIGRMVRDMERAERGLIIAQQEASQAA